ncbi:MAG TPA: hypothetical protein VGI30_05615 [Caulobacteraceae bacterium]
MRLIRILAAAAMIMSFAPASMAAVTPDHATPLLHLIRGGGGGGHGGGFHGHLGGFHGGYAHRGWGYRPRGYRYGFGAYPYAYACPYAYTYAYNPYCTFPGG